MLRLDPIDRIKKTVCCLLAFLLIFGPEVGYAQSLFVSNLPVPGTMVEPSAAFVPVLVKGLVVHPDKPLNFDFIVDSGNDSADQVVVKEQSQRMAQYFLAAITVPEDQLWVNLSPYEKDRVIENDLGQTVLGRDMLAQDYILKQVTSSLIYPEKGLGKEFWARVYAQAQAKFGTTDMPVDTFNKVWIMPEKAEVYEKGNAVYVTEAKLKVMLDSDRVAMAQNAPDAVTDEKAAVAKAVMREIVVPAIEKEVNEGKNFAAIRQVYHAAILAKWYRELIANTLLADAYVGKNKVAGVTTDEKALKEEIYQRYIAAYKKGVFNYIKEETDVTTGDATPRKYFSGGENLVIPKLDKTTNAAEVITLGKASLVSLEMRRPDGAQGGEDETGRQLAQLLKNQGVPEADVDHRFVMIFKKAAHINPKIDVKLLYDIYTLYKNELSSGDSFHYDTASEEVNWGEETITHTLMSAEDYDGLLSFFDSYLGIKNVRVEIRDGGWQGAFHAFYVHTVWCFLHFPEGAEDFMQLYMYLYKKGGVAPLDEILLGATKSPDFNVRGIMTLGRTVTGQVGSKADGFMVLSGLGYYYPKGFVLSERLVKAIVESSPEVQREYGVLIKNRMKEKFGRFFRVAVRSSPKRVMPGVLLTKVVNEDDLMAALIEVANSWYSDKARAFRQREGMSEAYDLPVIIQGWVSGEKMELVDGVLKKDAFYQDRRAKDPSLPLYAVGVFSTRNPNTNEDKIFGRYLENATGDQLMTEGKSGEDIASLEKKAPKTYRELVWAKKSLEEKAGPQEVEFVVSDGFLLFLQTRKISFSPQAEIAYIRQELINKKKPGAASVVPGLAVSLRIETLQRQLGQRKIYGVRKGASVNVIARAEASTSGAIQGHLVWNLEKARLFMERGESVIFVAHPGNREKILDEMFNYSKSGLITTYGSSSSHEADLTRLAGMPSLINLRVSQWNLTGDAQGIVLEGGQELKEGDLAVIDGESGNLLASGLDLLEESGIMRDVSYGVSIPDLRKEVLAPYLNEDGSIRPEVTVQELEALNQEALKELKRLSASTDEKELFTANLRKHFLHDLLTQRQGEDQSQIQSGGIDIQFTDQPLVAVVRQLGLARIAFAKKADGALIDFSDPAWKEGAAGTREMVEYNYFDLSGNPAKDVPVVKSVIEKTLEEGRVNDAIRLYTLNYQLFVKDQKALGDDISKQLLAAYKGDFRLVGKMGGTEIQWALATPAGIVTPILGQPTHSGPVNLGRTLQQLEENPENSLEAIMARLVAPMTELADRVGGFGRIRDYYFSAPGFFGPEGQLVEDQKNIANMRAGFRFDDAIPQYLAKASSGQAQIKGRTVHDGTGHAFGDKSVYGPFSLKDTIYGFWVGTGIASRVSTDGMVAFTGDKELNYLHNEASHNTVWDPQARRYNVVFDTTKGFHPDFTTPGTPLYKHEDLEDRTSGKALSIAFIDEYKRLLENPGDPYYSQAVALKARLEAMHKTGLDRESQRALAQEHNPLMLRVFQERAHELGQGIGALLVYLTTHKWENGGVFDLATIKIPVGGVIAQLGYLGLFEQVQSGIKAELTLSGVPAATIEQVLKNTMTSPVDDDMRELLGGLPSKDYDNAAAVPAPSAWLVMNRSNRSTADDFLKNAAKALDTIAIAPDLKLEDVAKKVPIPETNKSHYAPAEEGITFSDIYTEVFLGNTAVADAVAQIQEAVRNVVGTENFRAVDPKQAHTTLFVVKDLNKQVATEEDIEQAYKKVVNSGVFKDIGPLSFRIADVRLMRDGAIVLGVTPLSAELHRAQEAAVDAMDADGKDAFSKVKPFFYVSVGYLTPVTADKVVELVSSVLPQSLNDFKGDRDVTSSVIKVINAVNRKPGKHRDMAQSGGIDIQNIDVARKSGSANIQFNDRAVRDVIKGGFNGFTPVIISVTPMKDLLMF
ncbi:MAG: PEP/pyruvate-binding domain-containing protein [Candidatus Omnitrophota bacterium]